MSIWRFGKLCAAWMLVAGTLGMDGIGLAAQVKISGGLQPNGDVLYLTGLESNRVFYVADADTDEVAEIYAASVLGGTAAVKVSAPIPPGFQLAPDYFETFVRDGHLVYELESLDLATNQLVSVPIGSMFPIVLGESTNGSLEATASFHGLGPIFFTEDAPRALARINADGSGRQDLIPLGPSDTATEFLAVDEQLALPAGTTLWTVLGSFTNALYAVDGSGARLLDGGFSAEFVGAADGFVFYLVGFTGMQELRRVPLAGGLSQRIASAEEARLADGVLFYLSETNMTLELVATDTLGSGSTNYGSVPITIPGTGSISEADPASGRVIFQAVTGMSGEITLFDGTPLGVTPIVQLPVGDTPFSLTRAEGGAQLFFTMFSSTRAQTELASVPLSGGSVTVHDATATGVIVPFGFQNGQLRFVISGMLGTNNVWTLKQIAADAATGPVTLAANAALGALPYEVNGDFIVLQWAGVSGPVQLVRVRAGLPVQTLNDPLPAGGSLVGPDGTPFYFPVFDAATNLTRVVVLGDAEVDERFELFAVDVGGFGGVTAGGTTGGTTGGVIVDPQQGLPFGDFTQDGQGDVLAIVDGKLAVLGLGADNERQEIVLNIPAPEDPVVGMNRVFKAPSGGLFSNLVFYVVTSKGREISSVRISNGTGFGLTNFVAAPGPETSVRGKVAASGDFNGDGIIDLAIPRGRRLAALVSNTNGSWDELTLVGDFDKSEYGRILGGLVEANRTFLIGTKAAAEIGPEPIRLSGGVVGVKPAGSGSVPKCKRKTVAITTRDGKIVCVRKRRNNVEIDGEDVGVGLPIGPR